MQTRIQSFSNQPNDRKWLKRFIDFHWGHYRQDPQYVPLLDFEYLGNKLIGMTGFFEPQNLFFKHADMRFFLALQGDQVVGRCNAFVNHNHNRHWNDRVGFFGQFECIDDKQVARLLLDAAAAWLHEQGMDAMRGPQNLPVNEATPGLMTMGFDTVPVVYYHYNKPYYEALLRENGFVPVKQVKSWWVTTREPMVEKLERVSQKVIQRYGVTFETWNERPFAERRREMFEVYNDAWNDNWGFVPFTEEEFFATVKDMMLVMNKKLFLFVYVKGELAGFFGGVPNIFERMHLTRFCRRCELLRAARMLIGKGRIKSYRLGYMGVKRKFHNLGIDSVMLWKQKIYSLHSQYDHADLGWVLEDNVLVNRVAEWMNAKVSKIYTIFQKPID
ncbi:MAG TPA: hypothetical protein PKN04_04740 [bacterium]|nr:hypothetical protein [bacterium]HNT65068.1 hypothetical protein [bacterium]HOX84475.1 hypothetical protein [bacterium]HPG45928.1 hypothetical protein [bacterium]HPM97750.1 hypothetical protein [bacterium]